MIHTTLINRGENTQKKLGRGEGTPLKEQKLGARGGFKVFLKKKKKVFKGTDLVNAMEGSLQCAAQDKGAQEGWWRLQSGTRTTKLVFIDSVGSE